MKDLQSFYNEPMRSSEHKLCRKHFKVGCESQGLRAQHSQNGAMGNWGKKLSLLLLLASCASGQIQMPEPQPLDHRSAGRGQISSPDEPQDQASIHMQEQQRKQLNDLRQKRVVSDTDKLLRLAGELRAEVSAQQKAKSSTSSLRKADEIEKLAKSIRDKMKAF